MNILEIGGLAVIGLACGALVAAGMFTFITMLGIVTRLAQITKTARYILHYESWICAGAVLGNLLWLAVTMMEDFENWALYSRCGRSLFLCSAVWPARLQDV